MSEEEKEAIALLIVFNLANNLRHISEEDFADIKKAIRILINLIEKQQKELELNNECEIALNNRIFDLEDDISKMYYEETIINILQDKFNLTRIEAKELLEE